jgi:hypothetical protein
VLALAGGVAAAADRTQAAVPNLAKMCLRASDFPGSKLVRQQYVPDPDWVKTYEREFEGGKVGTSRLANAECSVALAASTSEAALFYRALHAIFTGPRAEVEAFFREAVESEGLGEEARLISLRVIRNRALKVGDGAAEVALVMRASDTEFGASAVTITFSFTEIRVGRTLGTIYLLSRPGTGVAGNDVARTAGLLARLMKAGLAAAS